MTTLGLHRSRLLRLVLVPLLVADLAGCVVFTEESSEDDSGESSFSSGGGSFGDVDGGGFGSSGGSLRGVNTGFSSGHTAGVRGGVASVDGPDNDDGDKTLTISSVVKSCLAGIDPFLPCVNERAMATLEQTESMETVRLDPGLEMARQSGADAFAPRGVYSFGDNPYNVGAVIEAASSLLSRRSFCWDLSLLYPGLQMRIGPTYNGRGMIDFMVDRRRNFDERGLGYGHLIFKRSFLPNVLATQISIASVIPFIFAAIYFLTKKAFILSKIAMVVTSVVGYGSLFLHHSSKPFGHSFGSQPPNSVHHPISGHHSGFIGDIRGDKFYGDFHGYQQISSSKPSSIFRGVNYFPLEAQAAYKEVKRDKKEAK